MCAAHHFGSSQWFLPSCFFPQGHQSRHLFMSKEANSHLCTNILKWPLSYEGNTFQFQVWWIFTLLCNCNFSASKISLVDIFDAEVGEPLGRLLLLFSGRGIIIRAFTPHWSTTNTLCVQTTSILSIISSGKTETPDCLGTWFYSGFVLAGLFFWGFEVCINTGSDWHVWERLTERIRTKLRRLNSSEEFSS